MFSLLTGVALYPVVLYHEMKKGYDEVMGITAALNHFADPNVELPDNMLDMFAWKASS